MVSKGSTRENLPDIFFKSDYGKCRAIIDCAEVFIEAKTYENQSKGFAEVTGNFHYKLADYKSPQDGVLSWLIIKK